MKQKYILLTMILFVFLFLFSTTSLALIPGDFGSEGGGPPDGCVDFEDLMIFAMAYGSTPADANWNPLCDIAGQGSATPDGVIDFEDLMIFAMHYGECECQVHNLTKDTYYNTIQEALDDADSLGGDTIEADDGTYNESITFPTGKVVTLQSASGIRDNVIIRGVNNLPTVKINVSLTGTTLSGFSITHTGGDTGRGIDIGQHGNLIIDNCTISGNSISYSGGGIHNSSIGTLTITGSTISGNSTGYYGGGIHNCYGTLDITLSDISGNTAGYYGGGIYNSSGTSTIISSTISGNTANWHGGGIYNYSGTSTIISSTISGNTANRDGGGIYIAPTSGTIIIGGNDASDTSNFNTFTDNKKDGIISADQHIRDSVGDCHLSYPNNYYTPN